MRPRRILSLWLPRLASDRALRGRGIEGPFVLVARSGSADRIACLNVAAQGAGLRRGMTLADARALCPGLLTQTLDPARDAAFLTALVRWAGRWSPLVGREGADGLVLDVTGVAHLFGGEAGLVDDLTARLARAGIAVTAGLACTRGAAFALARFAPGVALPGQAITALGPLPPAALRIADPTVAALDRLGLRRIRDLTALPRATLAQRFGPDLALRLDQALGRSPEPLAPDVAPPHFGTRMTLPDPIGLVSDVQAGLDRLLVRLCAQLDTAGQGARRLRLWLRRVDGGGLTVEIGLARPMRDAAAIAALFAPNLADLDAGFGIDLMRLTAPVTERLPARQMSDTRETAADRLADLITRLANRLGFEALTRMAPAESHIPERSFLSLAAAFPDSGCASARTRGPDPRWYSATPRPLSLFAPEDIAAPTNPSPANPGPPRSLRWRARTFCVTSAIGPERIAPEWWFDDPAWRSGLRDYWRVLTAEGPRLWLFHTPATGSWAVQGEFA